MDEQLVSPHQLVLPPELGVVPIELDFVNLFLWKLLLDLLKVPLLLLLLDASLLPDVHLLDVRIYELHSAGAASVPHVSLLLRVLSLDIVVGIGLPVNQLRLEHLANDADVVGHVPLHQEVLQVLVLLDRYLLLLVPNAFEDLLLREANRSQLFFVEAVSLGLHALLLESDLVELGGLVLRLLQVLLSSLEILIYPNRQISVQFFILYLFQLVFEIFSNLGPLLGQLHVGVDFGT